MNKAGRLKALFEEQAKCTDCPRLVKTRTNVVHGRGNPEARIVIVGEAPGEEEDKTGEPYRGRAGQTLDEIIESLYSDEPETGAGEDDFYILNCVACRPCIPNPLTGRMENTKPTHVEIANCRKWVHKIIYTIDPIVLILTGDVPAAAFGLKKAISKIQGQMFDVQIDGVNGPVTYAAMPVFHPSYLNRRRDKPELLENTKRHFSKVVERVWAYLRVARGLSPVPVGEEE